MSCDQRKIIKLIWFLLAVCDLIIDTKHFVCSVNCNRINNKFLEYFYAKNITLENWRLTIFQNIKNQNFRWIFGKITKTFRLAHSLFSFFLFISDSRQNNKFNNNGRYQKHKQEAPFVCGINLSYWQPEAQISFNVELENYGDWNGRKTYFTLKSLWLVFDFKMLKNFGIVPMKSSLFFLSLLSNYCDGFIPLHVNNSNCLFSLVSSKRYN